jgi:hypothetical protein
VEDIYKTPGFESRLRAGGDALQRSAAARGLTRTGGTLKDFIDYNQNFAANEYGQEFNRALSSYDRKYQGDLNTYDRLYQGTKDQYAPQLAAWQQQSQAEMAAALAQFQRQWEMYTFAHRNDGRGGGGGSQVEPFNDLPYVG